MVERLVADRTDRMGALRRRVSGRAHRVAISVSAGDPAFEAPSAAAVALRLALLFDDRERVCGPRAPAIGDCDDLVSYAGFRGSSCRTYAGRKGERGTDDRNRARISWRGDCDAPGEGRASANRSARCRGRCLQFALRAGHPQARWRGLAPNDARVDASRRPRVSHSDIALGLEAAWINGSLGSHGRDGCFRRPPATEC